MTPATGTGAAIFGCTGLTLEPDEAAFFRSADPFGFILFARNIDTPDQLRRLTADLRGAVGRDAPVFVDQEGGRVQRLRPPHWRDWVPPHDLITSCGPNAARALWLQYRIIADELRSVGIDANCAPCLDVLTSATHPFLRNRCFGDDAGVVTTLGRAAADGHLAGGVLPVIKHMPGHGRANADTHLNLPTVTATPDELTAQDFAPFAALRDLPLAMTAHIVFSAYDSSPATCSPSMIRVIREDIGFQGLLMTDDIAMEALSGTLAERTAASIAAGCDVVLHCNGTLAERNGVAEAAGSMSTTTLSRAAKALDWRKTPEPVDIAALEAEFLALQNGQGHG